MKKIVFAVFLFSFAVFAEEFTPLKVKPYITLDGDTFVAAQSQTVYRLYGVDAPEYDQPSAMLHSAKRRSSGIKCCWRKIRINGI